MQYEYPLITGYKWNAIQKISLALNVPMENIGFSENSTNTYIDLNGIELTAEQKAVLDNIMCNDPCGIPLNTGNTTYKINDFWSMREWFFTQWGFRPNLWFEQGNEDGTGECYIHVEFPKLLNATEKEQILNVYASSIKE